MPLDKRRTLILNELVNAEEHLFAKDLMKKLNVSKRTVYYDLEKINSWLEEEQLPAVMRSYSKGYYLDQDTKQCVLDRLRNMGHYHYYYTKNERVSLLGVLLILNKECVTANDLMDKTGVSRVTTFKDLDELKKGLEAFKLQIVFNKKSGYTVLGSESNKRKAIAYYLTQLFSHQGWDRLSEQVSSVISPKKSVLTSGSLSHHQSQQDHNSAQIQSHYHSELVTEKGIDEPDIPSDSPLLNHSPGVSDFYTLLLDYEKTLEIELTDEMLHTLALNLLIICKRIEQDLSVHIDKHEKTALKSTPEFSIAERLARIIEIQNGLILPEDEVCFLTMHLLGSKVNAINDDEKSKEMDDLRQVLKKMIFDFQKYACLFFQNQEELEKLMFVHLKPAYYRIKYDVFTENPLTENIADNYREVFQITKKVIFHLEHLLGKEVGDPETAYIAMYFGGWMRRQGSTPSTRQRAIIVCESGIGTSNLLRFQLEQLLTTLDIVAVISSRDYLKNHYDIDLFFSTVAIQEKNKPVILVHPILTDEDKRHLLAKLNAIGGGDASIQPTLSSLLSVIQKHASIIDEQKLIQDLKSLLQLNEFIPKESRKPMLHELLTEKTIRFKSHVDHWEDAIVEAANPLLEQDFITQEYVDSMIDNVKNLGPYIVIVPRIAIPHARPEQGVKKLGMSLLGLKNPVSFSEKEEHQVRLVIVLAAVDNDRHLQALSQLINLLSDEEKVAKIMDASSPYEVVPLLIELPVTNN